MSKLIITRGLPGSGKTTHARSWVAEDPDKRARINRDDLRAMVHDTKWSADNERSIQAVRDAAITALLRRGIDVISDDTNLPSRVARDLRRLATVAGAGFEVVDLTNVPLDTCIDRNGWRGGTERVPVDRIVDMHKRYIAGKPYPLPIANDQELGSGRPYVPDTSKPKAIIVDIDGTVALMGTRSPFDETRVHEDKPNTPVIDAVRAMTTAGYEVVFCSGRTEACRDATEAWLAEHIWRRNVLLTPLFMRPTHDMRKDSIVKLEIFDKHIRDNYNVVAVFDDREQVVQMWRSIGLTVFAVADGKF